MVYIFLMKITPVENSFVIRWIVPSMHAMEAQYRKELISDDAIAIC